MDSSCYGNGGGAELTVTLYVEKDTVVTLRLINDCRPGRYFGYYQDPNDGKANNPYITYLTVNGETVGVTPSTKTYASQGWNVFMHCDLATIELKAGVANVISFKLAEKNDNDSNAGDNINYAGISIVGSPGVPVTLGDVQ